MCSDSLTADVDMAALHQDDNSSINAESPCRQGRLKVWQMRENMGCSVVGTCLTQSDLTRILNRCGLQLEADVTPYQLHSYVVRQICQEGSLACAAQKLLDKRHEGIIRIVGRTPSDGGLRALWKREFDAGRVPGAYWALQTHAHISKDLHAEVFGEVHMLSHVLGRTVHSTAARASEQQARLADLEAHVARQTERQHNALSRRDDRIAQLENQLARTQSAICCAVFLASVGQVRQPTTK